MADTASRDENNVPTLLAVSSVDSSSPVKLYANPTTHRLLVDAAGGGFVQAAHPTGTVDGVNTVFTFTVAPAFVVVDGGRSMMATSSDGTVNWTGTTTITLSTAPTFDIFGVY